jgi:HK97 family phage prohead protease
MTQLDITRSLPIDDLSVQGDGRSVVLRLLTYGRDYTVSDDGASTYQEAWRSGAFRRWLSHGHGGGVPLTFEHDAPTVARSLPIGGSRRVWEDGDRLMLEGRISRTSMGDDLVELLRDDVIRGVSVRARIFERKARVGGFEYLQGALRDVALTTAPQYDDAELVAVRSEVEQLAERPRLDALRKALDTLPTFDVA